MTRGALVALSFVLCGACRSEIQLGNPDSGSIATSPTGTGVVPPRCPGVTSRAVVTTAESSWGDLRAIAVGKGTLYALFARDGTNQGVLTRVPTSGGALIEVAQIGLDPSALALSADGSFVFATAHGSSQVFRVDDFGTAIVANARGGPSAIVADDAGGAFWTVPSEDAVVGWAFAGGAPATVATSPLATSLLRVSGTLYVAGNRSISAFTPGADDAPRKIADHCDGTPAIDGDSLYCADAGSIARVDLASGTETVVATSQPQAGTVVRGGGRIFWRAAPRASQTLVMALALDALRDTSAPVLASPTIIESSGSGPLLIAQEGCDLYFTAGRSLVRRGL